MINREDLLSGTRPEVGSRILMTVENNFQGYEIVDYKGMVWGISMRSKDMGQDFLMGCKQFTGGELSSIQNWRMKEDSVLLIECFLWLVA